MTEQLLTASPIQSSREELVVPVRYLSSADVGWDTLTAEAYHEPARYEGFVQPASSAVSLVLFAGGAMYLEWRQRGTAESWRGRRIEAGDLTLSAPNTGSYELRWHSLSQTPSRTLHLSLDPDLLAGTAEAAGIVSPSQPALISRTGFHDPLLAHVGFALWRELADRSPAGRLYAHTAAQLLALHLLRHYITNGASTRAATGSLSSRGLTSRQLGRVHDFMSEHLDEDVSLELLAQQAGFSSYHFARLFRHTTGESPHRYLLRQRIDYARRLLEEQDISLAEITVITGFANQSHFTRNFKRFLGVTPGVYRRQFTR